MLNGQFIFEFLILCIHPIPYYDKAYTFYFMNINTKTAYQPFHYSLSHFLFCFMFLRVYFVIRTIMNYTMYQELHS